MDTPTASDIKRPECTQTFWGWMIRFIIVALCFWQSRNLLDIWQHSPYDAAGLWAFLIWLLPLRQAWDDRARGLPSAIPMWGAVGLCMGAIFVDMHVVAYYALALSIIGLRQWAWTSWVWLVGAISWMNVIGYTLSNYGYSPTQSIILRFVLVCLSIGCALYVEAKSIGKQASKKA
ncbi:MAG: hypothetical protein B7X06_01155 [Verrucomicrobia bacterium 21-51-4]|nr:MAG: hypothetical protein B7X06_01155 [Verrucomicrobia bacterium 21-51-4]HQU08647.1 hypothetical protein [Opitutales bacterium]